MANTWVRPSHITRATAQAIELGAVRDLLHTRLRDSATGEAGATLVDPEQLPLLKLALNGALDRTRRALAAANDVREVATLIGACQDDCLSLLKEHSR